MKELIKIKTTKVSNINTFKVYSAIRVRATAVVNANC